MMVIVEFIGVVFVLWYCCDVFDNVEWCNWLRVFDCEKVMWMMVFNFDILICLVMLMVIFMSFVFIGVWFGDVILVVNEVLI